MEVLGVAIERECRRVAAFGLTLWREQLSSNPVLVFFEGRLDEVWVRWDIERATARVKA